MLIFNFEISISPLQEVSRILYLLYG